MRRALASLLLTLFSFPLIVPLLRADAASTLPSCCRRAGKHHCSTDSESRHQEGLSPVQPKCCDYPATIAIPGHWNLAFIRNFPSISASLLRYSSTPEQTEAKYRVSFSRSRQKRGPPAFLS
jgi:hypothetical protein